MKYELNSDEIDIIIDGLTEILWDQRDQRNAIQKHWDEKFDPKTEAIGRLNISISNIEILIQKLSNS